VLVLPVESPDPQAAEHIWPLSNEVLVRAYFADLDTLDVVQFARHAYASPPAPA